MDKGYEAYVVKGMRKRFEQIRTEEREWEKKESKNKRKRKRRRRGSERGRERRGGRGRGAEWQVKERWRSGREWGDEWE